ncbi:MAG TPA: glycosyltransferase, partial [Vicinamibacterales bacterium]
IYEVVVVDNNSTDDTRDVVQRVMARDATGRLRYVFEPRQGVSYARNTGVEQTSAPLILFLDDDGMPGREWVREMFEAFRAHPEAHCIGGRVTARWDVPPPAWMDKPHYGPVALQDRPAATYVNARSASTCLLTANLGVRREVFDRVGGFSPAYPRNQDREWEMRVWRAGLQGLYLPAMEVKATVPPERLTRRYHRRWQARTGMYHALMRFRDTVDASGTIAEEPVGRRTLFGSPLFLYRECAGHMLGWVRSALMLRSSERFFHETRLWYYASFFRTRFSHRNA